MMWEDAGIIRDADSLKRAAAALDGLHKALNGIGVASGPQPYHMAWHDWLNLNNLILVSRTIVAAAEVRDDSRGAHYRADFPETRDVETSWYTRVRMEKGQLAVNREPVDFTRVRPGESLV